MLILVNQQSSRVFKPSIRASFRAFEGVAMKVFSALALALVLGVAALAQNDAGIFQQNTVSNYSRPVLDTGYYTNVDGHSVHRPSFSSEAPPNATAQCGDGSYSFSQHRRGTCSHHGGVGRWL